MLVQTTTAPQQVGMAGAEFVFIHGVEEGWPERGVPVFQVGQVDRLSWRVRGSGPKNKQVLQGVCGFVII